MTAQAIGEWSLAGSSAEDVHGALGARLGEVIRDVVTRRLAATSEAELVAQLRTIRGTALHLARARETAPHALASALAAYRASLSAWARAAELTRVLPALSVDGARFTADELALWLQDDNTGCQTGALRQADGSVLLFHTEEDTIGYFDRPRVVHMDVAGARRSAFLYPYLLPGPAFGWHERAVFAYDTLNLQRTHAGGTPTSTFSWLVWWTRGELPTEVVARALTPFLDGGALSVVTRGPDGVHAECVAVGGHAMERRALGSEAGARFIQVNMVEHDAELCALELYDAEGRAPYVARIARAERLLGGALDAPALARVLGSREGESWAFANDDVVAHFVAHVTREGVRVYAGAGAAQGEGAFDATWALP